MKKFIYLLPLAAALSLGACDNKRQEATEAKADAIEKQADAAKAEGKADAKAEKAEGEAKADSAKAAGDAQAEGLKNEAEKVRDEKKAE